MMDHKLASWVIAVVLIVGLVAAPVLPANATSATPAIDPAFLSHVTAHPGEMFPIIVQGVPDADLEALERQVSDGGGEVKARLNMISGFSADLAGAQITRLAADPQVRWISFDAPMISTDATEEFTAWATALGTATVNRYANAEAVVDGSGLGPNGTYAYRSGTGRGTFGGFTVEAVPGYDIIKVEAVLYGYVNAPSNRNYQVTAFVNGEAQPLVTVKTSIFNNVIGEANAGPVYVDLTSIRAWQWADFYNDLELYIGQANLSSLTTFYYDAVGLRVTSAPGGTDTSLEALPTTTEADSTVDGSKQVNVYNQVIGSPKVWNRGTMPWLQGKFVTVAVLDSGILRTEDLGWRVRVNVNFNRAYHDGIDRYGHGTFVAGIIGGNGRKSLGKYIGVAPRATLLNVRVTDDQGMVYESDVVAAMQWVYDNKDLYGIRVVNLSFNSSMPQSYDTSPLDAAAEILWFNNIVVVVAAGNQGAGELYPPANDPFVITVGSTDDKGTVSTADDTLANFSAYGITESGYTKPDLVTPGRLIIGLLPDNDKLSMGIAHPDNRVDSTYFMMSGTSVSAPMVSGAVAILLQDEPNLTPDQVKYRLMATANKAWPAYDPASAGAGYLNILAAVKGTTTESANTGITASQLLTTGSEPIAWNSVGWNSVGWNTVGWNTVGWNTVGWNTVGWNTVGWSTDHWDP